MVGMWWSDAVGGARFGSGDLRTADVHEKSRVRQGTDFRSAMSVHDSSNLIPYILQSLSKFRYVRCKGQEISSVRCQRVPCRRCQASCLSTQQRQS